MKTGILVGALCLNMSVVMANDGFLDDWEERADAVSEGELVWYPGPPPGDIPSASVSARFMENSHEHGWMQISQCHRGLSEVSLAQIVFQGRAIRKLQVDSYVNIGKAYVEGDTVQLSDIRAGGEVCLSSEQQALYKLDEHHWAFISGPFQRRFLDGYYPSYVEVEVHWPAAQWRFIKVQPSPGPVIEQGQGQLKMKAHFAGRLKAGLVFQRALSAGK